MNLKPIAFVLGTLALTPTLARATAPENIPGSPEWKRKIPTKYQQNFQVETDKDGEVTSYTLVNEEPLDPAKISSPFTPESIASGKFVLEKSANEEKHRDGRAAPEKNDDPEKITGKITVKNIYQMESKKLNSAHLHRIPWSSSYWPTYAGGIALRYADNDMSITQDWEPNTTALRATQPSPDAIAKLTPEQIDIMSPAQKYDLLIGDSAFSLTNYELSLAAAEAKTNGKVERWEGKCHGWAPSAFKFRRPQRAISVMSVGGQSIRFYPEDIKALATALWANAKSTKNISVGARCRIQDPPTDANGRLTDQSCFDTNPMTWHLLAVNQIGVNQKGFVLDATFDYQVWNQPAYAYEYTYFNPITARKNWTGEPAIKYAPVAHLQDALVSRADFVDDPFKAYRKSDAVSYVGIDMKFTYVSEKETEHKESETSKDSNLTAVHYYYDLGLDKNGNIVEGEWWELVHPDFMWTPKSKPLALGDESLQKSYETSRKKPVWVKREKTPIPVEWRNAAIDSSKRGQPLATIVEELIQKSRKIKGSPVRNWFYGIADKRD